MQPVGVIMDEIDRKLLAVLQEGFPLTSRPYRELGEAVGVAEPEVMARLAALQKEGLIRRIGPILDLRKMGLAGMLAACLVPVEEADEGCFRVRDFRGETHVYPPGEGQV